MIRVRVRFRVMVRVKVMVSVNNNNSGAGELTDKPQLHYFVALLSLIASHLLKQCLSE